MNLAELEQQSIAALKNRETIKSRTLRLLIARLKNERIAAGHELSDEEVLVVVRSEYKRRREAAEEFEKGGRGELAAAELEEAAVLEGYLPAQVAETDIVAVIEEQKSLHGWTNKDFGVAMKALKERFGGNADGAVLARLLKEKLN